MLPESSSLPDPPSSLPTSARTSIVNLTLKIGILGVFLLGVVVAAGSFALFGCMCGPQLTPPGPEKADPAPPKPAATTDDG